MNYESEAELENKLIKQLVGFSYEKVSIKNISDLKNNLKIQLEKINEKTFTDNEFSQILNHLEKGSVFEKSHTLRDRMLVKAENGEDFYIQFLKEKKEDNIFQITHQVEVSGKYENRYDVSILINGLPLVQIELKRRGLEMKEAFNQINRYHKHSFVGTLFEYVQIFIISNGVDVKYFSNNYGQSYEQTFFWTDEKNKKISELEDFAEAFLKQDFILNYIREYIVLAESKKIPMVLRPYQYYAVRKIVERVKNTNENGYIWHTTGSGKTLTSFKTAQILKDLKEVKKVLFVVDRKDLDVQTVEEFQSFDKDSVDGSENTKALVKNLEDSSKKLIVTTIQKLERVLKNEAYKNRFKNLENEKVVIIFDEAHRSQFGETHKRIKEFFKNSQLFGFTGTPIFAENANNGKTTKDLFTESLHKYIITDAISDNNVLGFHLEYVGKVDKKDNLEDGDKKISNIEKKEFWESDDRVEKNVKHILKDWKRKTQNGKFNAMLAVSSVDLLKKYYLELEKEKSENFKIATIFSYKANEEDKNDGSLDVEEEGQIENQHSREFLDYAIDKYNKDFGVNFSSGDFESYRKDLQKRVKDNKNELRGKGQRVDLVIVVNMMLTGFDAQKMNTLFVDKNLKYHGLIQAYSRTNRLFNSTKPHGNIVVFRNLKKATDEALKMYGSEDNNEIVFRKPYKEQVKEFNEKVEDLKKLVSEYFAVDNLKSEEEKGSFVKKFRDLMRMKVSLEYYDEFSWEDLRFAGSQEYENYKSKYFEIFEQSKKKEIGEKESILNDLNYEVELLFSEDVNYDYIIALISEIASEKDSILKDKKIKNVLDKIKNDLRMRKKEDLIQKFIEEIVPKLEKGHNVKFEFEKFWEEERKRYMNKIIEENNFDKEKFEKIISEYYETEKIALTDELLELLPEDKKPGILERESVGSKIKSYIFDFVEKFDWVN